MQEMWRVSRQESISTGRRGMNRRKVAGGDVCVEDGAAVLVFAAVYEQTTLKYGKWGVKYVHMEVGHAARNVYLQAVSLGLGTVVVGVFL